ncbi:hypothetical protein GGH95_003913 [Coemansia sp. RSA 1836]|nr:hypothetical protein GGH95_003913 [Coemansia sp. RSA 1836]
MLYSWRAQPGVDDGRLSMFDKRLRPVLRPNALYYLRIMALSTVMLWMPMSLFFGAIFRRATYIHRTHIEVVDLDGGGLVGRQITQSALLLAAAAAAAPDQQMQPTWRIRSDLATLSATKEWVRRHGWAALVINSGASARLADALSGSAAVYNPADAMTLILSTGRHPIIETSYIQPALTAIARAAQREFAVSFVSQLQAAAGTSPQNLATLATQPIAFRVVNAAPMSFGLAPIVYLFSFLVGQLCVIAALITWKMTSFSFFLKAKHVHVWLGAVALVLAWAVYIGMLSALAISAFRGPTYSALALPYTVGRFFSLWFTTAMVLSTSGLWLLSWFAVLTPELLALASLSVVLPNVVATLTPVETAPRFFRWLYALPFYNGAMLYRYILSGGYPRLGLNLGVVLGELCLWALLLGLATWVRQYVVVGGLSDVPGWYRGSIFFARPAAAVAAKDTADDAASIADAGDDDATSLRTGNLGV